ncbi:conserved hypothetical protein [Pseudomonas zeae]
MSTDQAQIVSEDMTIKFVAELSAQCATTGAPDKGAEDSSGHSPERDTQWAGHGANSSASLASCQCSTDATSGTAHRTDGGGDFHGLMEGGNFGGVTARALQ